MSQLFEINWKNLQKIAKFLRNVGYQVEVWTKYVSNNENLYTDCKKC